MYIMVFFGCFMVTVLYHSFTKIKAIIHSNKIVPLFTLFGNVREHYDMELAL